MKKVFLLMVVSALLVTLGFAQTPDAHSNTDQATVNGCLGGSNGNYTVAEDGTRQILKITSSSVDLTPHLGHAVKLTGHKASGAVSSGASENSFAVTELTMISEPCAVAVASAAAAPIVTHSVFGDCHRNRAGLRCTQRDCQHTRFGRCGTGCDCHSVFGDGHRTRCERCSANATISPSSQTLSNTG